LQLIWADGGYAGKLVTWATTMLQGTLVIVKRPRHTQGFQAETPCKTPSVRRATFWLLKTPQELTSDQEAFITQLCTISTEIKEGRALSHAFAQMFRERQANGLPTWLENAEQSAVAEIRSFATGIRQDEAAVTAPQPLSKPPVPRPSPQSTPEGLPEPILHCLSRRR
jgi:hypothetical protein